MNALQAPAWCCEEMEHVERLVAPTASVQSYMIHLLLRWQFKRRLQRFIVRQVRSVFNSLPIMRPPAGLIIERATVGGIACEWAEPQGISPIDTLLYIHGGGYLTCSPQTHRRALDGRGANT